MDISGWQGVRYKKLAKVMNTEGVGTGAVPAPSSTPGGTRLGQFYCERCDISVNSQVQLQQHLSGEKHKMRVSGQLPVPSRDRGRGCHSGRSRGGKNAAQVPNKPICSFRQHSLLSYPKKYTVGAQWIHVSTAVMKAVWADFGKWESDIYFKH